MLASLRYLDTFVTMDGAWLFAKRRLYAAGIDGKREDHEKWTGD